MEIFQKIQNLKLYPKSTKTEVKKMVITIINSGKNAAAYYQILEEVPGPLVPEKIQKQ